MTYAAAIPDPLTHCTAPEINLNPQSNPSHPGQILHRSRDSYIHHYYIHFFLQILEELQVETFSLALRSITGRALHLLCLEKSQPVCLSLMRRQLGVCHQRVGGAGQDAEGKWGLSSVMAEARTREVPEVAL